MTELVSLAYKMNYSAVGTMYKTFANGFVPKYSAPSALAPGFRNAAVWQSFSIVPSIYPSSPSASAANSLQSLSHVRNEDWLPEFYKLGNSSYFSESLYDMDSWKQRYGVMRSQPVLTEQKPSG